MANLGKLFVELLTLAGYDANDATLQHLVTSDIDVPDAAASAIKSGLFTEESAKNNPNIKKHFTAQALNTVDADLDDYITKYTGFSDEDKTLFKAEKSSYKRVKLVIDKVKEIESAKAGKGDDTAVAAYKAEIAKLNSQVLEKDGLHSAALVKLKNDMETTALNHARAIELNGRNYANKGVDKDVNVMVAEALIKSEMAAKGVSVVMGANGQPRLVRTDAPELDYMIENKVVNFGSFVDNVLGEKKMLEVSKGGDSLPADKNRQIFIPEAVNGDKYPVEASNFYAEQIASFQD
jgi:flagellar biosynthesis GTPase FlhF